MSQKQKALEPPSPTAAQKFSLVAIGASAGGLEALKTFFSNVPDDCQHSFVIIQHLSPDYKSLMAELLSKNTNLSIHEVTDQMPVEIGSIYLIPARKIMTLDGNRLKLSDKPDGHELHLPIDEFFKSLAETHREDAIAIVLSGTGSDGTRGVRAVKEAGGMVMVQTPEQAKFDGMPQSAINTGLADYISPVERLPQELLEFINLPKSSSKLEHAIERDETTLMQILNHVKHVTGMDFTLYKRPTLIRRVARRMNIRECATLQDYLKVIYDEKNEVHVLYHEFLIRVTRFFRDPEVWKAMERDYIPEIIRSKQDGDTVKVWCAGCCTGEEAYSMAILLNKEVKKQNKELRIKVFGTDINENSLEFASKGIYPDSIVADVLGEDLMDNFIRSNEHYQIASNIRKLIIFSKHNILSDPPFSKVDLVLCRNLLIYLQTVEQQRVINAMHYSLKLGGILMLGTSESIGEYKEYFKTLDRKLKLYRNVVHSRTTTISPLNRQAIGGSQLKLNSHSEKLIANARIVESFSELLMDELGAACIYIDENFDILHAVGELHRYVALPKSGFSANLLKIVPESLAVTLSTAIRKASSDGLRVSYKGVRIQKDEKIHLLNLLVQPTVPDAKVARSRFVIALLPQKEIELSKAAIELTGDAFKEERFMELTEELKHTRESLQSTIEEVETSNEELQATNEELLAANEELQSTNEELQSVNEELHSVNSEYQQKLEDLASLNADMDNLLKSADIGTIFLDSNMRIRKFTPAISKQFNLREYDIGRSIENFKSHIGNDTLVEDSMKVMETGEPIVKEIQTNKGAWFLKRTMPFINSYNTITGVVISFIDVQNLKEVQQKYIDQNLAFHQVLEGTMAGYWDWYIEREDVYLSPTLKQMLGYKDDEIDNHPASLQSMMHPDDLEMVQKNHIEHVESKGKIPFDRVVRYYHKNGEVVWIYCRGKVIEWSDDWRPIRMIGSHVDITELKNVQEELQRSNANLQQYAYIASHDLQEPLNTISSFAGLLSEQYSDELNEKAEKYLDFIQSSSEHMKTLIKGLLEYSRIGRSRELTEVDCNVMVADIQKELTYIIDKTTATIQTDTLPVVQAYATELKMLFQNLISNAIKFRKPDEHPSVKISSSNLKGSWKFSVADRGIGIPTEHQEKIFELFKRLHSKSDYEGTGIGLAHCKKIVEVMGGKIWLKSTVGTGTTFFFTIPKFRSATPSAIVEEGGT